MQDRYAGDVGDFSKFQLLRALHRAGDYRIGVNWYLFPDESHNKDGGHLSYLTKPAFQTQESELIQKLGSVANKSRSVMALEQAQILPQDTKYIGENIPLSGGLNRIQWFERSIETLKGSDIVMADPDNGFVPGSVGNGSRKYGKYIEEKEVKAYLEIAKAVVVYQHFNRNGTHREQMKNIADRCADFGAFGSPIVLRFRKYSPRMYVLLAKDFAWHSRLSSVAQQLTLKCSDWWES
jgi:hypothetical protein